MERELQKEKGQAVSAIYLLMEFIYGGKLSLIILGVFWFTKFLNHSHYFQITWLRCYGISIYYLY